jgi:flagellar L-ring protein FlgH
MNVLKKAFLLSLIFILNSCSNYINQMHSEFDRADGVEQVPRQSRNDQFNMYRQNQVASQNPTVINSANRPNMAPSIKRNYTSSTNVQHRYKAEDLIDNQNTGSLWAGNQAQDNYLFTNNSRKSNGDIVLIKVESKLKDEITAELKRAFPTPVNNDPDLANNNQAPGAGPAPASAATPPEQEKNEDTVYDRISSVVVEEINKDHILLRGRKNVLYHNRKRVVEIQALVSRRDIASDDTVLSNRIIENNITVIR